MHRYWPKLNAKVLKRFALGWGFRDERTAIISFTDEDRTFISNAMFSFLATVDANGQPQCSYKSGGKGVVKITDPAELVFPFYEGNGIYLSAGNLAAMGKIGLLKMLWQRLGAKHSWTCCRIL